MSFRIPLAHEGRSHLAATVGMAAPASPLMFVGGFLVDTGADLTMVSHSAFQAASLFGLPLVRFEQIGGIGGLSPMSPVVRIPVFSLAGVLEFHDVEVVVSPMPGLIQGLIGGDLLRQLGGIALNYDPDSPYLEGGAVPATAILRASGNP